MLPLCRPAPLLSILLLSIPAPGRPRARRWLCGSGGDTAASIPFQRGGGRPLGWVGGWVVCLLSGWLSDRGDRALCCQPPCPALLRGLVQSLGKRSPRPLPSEAVFWFIYFLVYMTCTGGLPPSQGQEFPSLL